MKTPLPLLRDMRDTAAETVLTIQGLEFAAFAANNLVRKAAILDLNVIGESAAKLLRDFPEIAEQYPELPLQQMRGIRNRISHSYYALDLRVIWNTVNLHIPVLLEDLDRIIAALEPDATKPGQPGRV